MTDIALVRTDTSLSGENGKMSKDTRRACANKGAITMKYKGVFFNIKNKRFQQWCVVSWRALKICSMVYVCS